MIPAQYRAECEYCGLEVDVRSHHVFQRVAGWAENRPKGTNALALQRRLPRWACAVCVDGLRRGIAPAQGRLELGA